MMFAHRSRVLCLLSVVVVVACVICAAPSQADPLPAPPQAPAAAAPADAPPGQLVVLRLTNNSLLVGHVVREEGDTVVFDAGALGQMTIKKSDIVQQLDPATVAAAFQAAPGAPPAGTGGSNFSGKGKVTWSRMFALTGFFMSAPYVLGNLDPRYPPLTGAALKLPGKIYQSQSQLSVQRATERDLWFLEGSDSYTFADNAGKQVDNPTVSGGYNFKFANSKTMYGVTRYTYLRDGIKQIKYSNQGLLGVGFKVADSPKLKVDLIPGFALQYDKKGTPFDNKWLMGGGGLEILTWTFRPFSQIEQRVLASQAFNHRQYYNVDASVTFKGMVTKIFGLTLGVNYVLDNALGLRPTPIPANALFPGQEAFSVLANERAQVIVNTGLLIKF